MTHIIDVRMHGEADNSPLQMISAARLAYLERMEALATELVAVMGRGREVVDRALTTTADAAAKAVGGEGRNAGPPP